MKRLLVYWLAWVLGALAFWLTLGWFGLIALAIDPYFDRQVDAVTAAKGGPLGKSDVAEIERNRSSAVKGLGVLGGVLCGFAFGVAASRFSSRKCKESTA